MSQITSGTVVSSSKSGPDIYTVLAIVATLALGLAVGYVAWTNTKLTGDSNPFAIKTANQLENVAPISR